MQGPRARALFGPDTPIVYKNRGRIGSIGEIAGALRKVRSGWVYAIDLGIPLAPLAAILRRMRPQVRLAFEIGDPALPLLVHQGGRDGQAMIAHAMDRRLPSMADRLVFRGSYLASYFAGIAPGKKLPPHTWIPDGVDPAVFRPMRDDPSIEALRRKHGLEGRFVVGLVGSIHHVKALNLFYGWELAEALALLPHDSNVRGVVVGDGPGMAILKATRDRLGLRDRLILPGRVPHAEVPAWINAFDLALSTQTDDPVGWGRTTAKLPEYLACGTPVMATDVGEAHRWLADSGQTLPYRGLRDDGYPARLAARIVEMVDRDLTAIRHLNRDLALEQFDYSVIRRRLAEFFNQAHVPR